MAPLVLACLERTRPGRNVTAEVGHATGSAESSSRDDVDLFAWLRHYALVFITTVALGLVAGIAIGLAERPPAEAWTYVIETRARIPSKELAPLAEAVFASSALYGPAMEALNDREPPATFLERVELRPVPASPMLIVVGRASTAPEADRISSATARALIAAFAQAGFPDFSILGLGPAIVRPTLSPRVLSMVGACVGLWLGLAVAFLHYQVRRPELSPRRRHQSQPLSGSTEAR